MPSESPPSPTTPLVEVDRPTEPLEASLTLQIKNAEQALASEDTGSHPMLLQDVSPNPAEDQASHSPTRDGTITAARKTFKTIEILSGLIPGFGNFFGAGAKVGLAFVTMIEVRLVAILIDPQALTRARRRWIEI